MVRPCRLVGIGVSDGCEALRRLIPPISHCAPDGLWNYQTSGALLFMPNAHSRASQVGVPSELAARAKATSVKWHERLQRGLLKIWLGLPALWIGCILGILGQCVYGPWIGWQQLQCDTPLVNPVETYLADFATALGPPAAVLLLHRVVMWWSRRVRRSQ
jgi:hypothetical protein